MVDIEADGPIPGKYSMVSFGAVIVRPGLSDTFFGKIHPVSTHWIPDALKVSGYTREETLKFDEPRKVMAEFRDWIAKYSINRPRFIADNNGFDWQFINYYFHYYLNENPFGFSSTNLGSYYKGCVKDDYKSFKRLRKTKHTHNPVDDAMGNAEALLTMKDKFHINMKLE